MLMTKSPASLMLLFMLILSTECYNFEWNTVTIDITSNYIYCLTYGNDTFMIGADDIYYSYNVEEWYKVNANLSSTPVRAIGYGYNDDDIPMWVGCSGYHNIIYSYNGIDWYAGTSDITSSSWTCNSNIVSGRVCPIDDTCHNIFIMTSSGSSYDDIYSYDGISWYSLSNTQHVHNAIAYGNVSYSDGDKSGSGIFVGGNYGSQCSTYYSYDGINWNYGIYSTSLYYNRQIAYGLINGSDYMFITYIVDSTEYGYSYNGRDWYFNNIINKSAIGSVVFGYDVINDECVPMIMMIGNYYSQYTYNGIDWYQLSEENIHKQVTTSSVFKSIYGLTTDSTTGKSYGAFVAVHTDNTIIYSKLPLACPSVDDDDTMTTANDVNDDITLLSPSESGLSTGAIVGIVITCVVVVTCITVGIIFGVKNKRQKRVRVRMYRHDT